VAALVRTMADVAERADSADLVQWRPSGLAEPPSDGAAPSVGRVSPQTRLVLEVAAVLGCSFDVADVAKVLRCPVATLAHPVREALGANLLVDRGMLAFSGDRTHRAVYDAIPSAVRKALQVEVARALLGECPDPAVPGPSLHPVEVAKALERAADDAEVESPRVAARLRLLVLDLASGEGRMSPERTLCTVHLLVRAGDAAQAQALAAAALREAPPSEVRAQLHLELATSLMDEGRAESALRHATVALAMEETPSQLQASLWATRSAAHCRLGDATSTMVSGRRALVLARRSHQTAAACRALLAMSEAEQMSGRLGHSLRQIEQALQLALSARAAIPMTEPLWAHGRALMLLDRLTEASASFEGGRREEERRSSGRTVTLGHACRASLMLQRGQLEHAWSEAQAGLDSASVLGTWEAAAELYAVMVEVLALRGELDRAGDLVRKAALFDPQDIRGRLALMWAAAHVEEERGEPRQAWTCVTTALRLPPQGLQGFLVDPLGGARLARLAITVGDRRGALSAVRLSERLAALNPGVLTIEASAALARGMVHGEAARLQEGVGLLRSSDRPIALAWACEAAARQDGVLAKPSRRRLMEEARAEYERFGATGFAAHSWDQGPSGPVTPARDGPAICRTVWQSLTSAERRIADEVSRGLTNREIARRLFISQNTVESHLKHIYPKLGIHSRSQLAVMVATHEEPAPANHSHGAYHSPPAYGSGPGDGPRVAPLLLPRGRPTAEKARSEASRPHESSELPGRPQ
jgi:DNA-binding CsgD family transcriptional regulator/tetratricopeptide (TPR) repeat protein